MNPAILLGLTAAVGWGAAVLLEGAGARKVGYVKSSFWFSVICTVFGAFVAAALRDELVLADVAWGALAGVFSILGISPLHKAMQDGQFAIAVPISAAGTACITALWGLIAGDPISAVSWFAIAIGIIGIAVVSWPDEPVEYTHRLTPALLSVISAIGFGGAFIMYDQTSKASGLWPLVPGYGVTTLVLLPAFLLSKSRRLTRTVARTILPASIMSLLATAAFLTATRASSVAVASVLGSLYPAVTAIMAWAIFNEGVSKRRAFGVVLTIVCPGLLAVGSL